MNSKGFTLVELLAVIVILAIILAISIPSISGIVANAKASAFQYDAKMLIKAIDYKKMQDSTFNPTTINEGNVESVLKISDDNYADLTVTVVSGKTNVSITGQGKWNGLTAVGDYSAVTVSNTSPPVLAYYYMQPGVMSANCNTGDTSSGFCMGEISLFPYAFTPAGYMSSDGRTLSISSYTALFALIGNAYGGNGTTTFALPNLTGSAPLTGMTYYIAVTAGTFPGHNSVVPITSGSYNYFSYQTTSRDYLLGEIRLAANVTGMDSVMLPCDGRLLLVSSNGALFALIGNKFGGNGSTNFALPDLSSAISPVTGAHYYMIINGQYPST